MGLQSSVLVGLQVKTSLLSREHHTWRYRSPAVPTAVDETEHGFRLALDVPAYGVAAGQTAVLYESGVVVGAGVL